MGRKKKEGIMRLLDLRKPQFVNEGLVSVVFVVPLILLPLSDPQVEMMSRIQKAHRPNVASQKWDHDK